MEKVFGDSKFQFKVLMSVWQNQETTLLHTILKPEYFDDLPVKAIFKCLQKLVRKHGTPITFEILSDACRKLKVSGLKKRLKKLDQNLLQPTELEYIESRATEFCRYQSVVNILQGKAVTLLEKGDLNELENDLVKAFAIGRMEFGKGIEYFTDVAIRDRLKERLTRKDRYYTLIPELDKFLDLRLGQLAVFLGCTGKGKTMLMAHLAKSMIVQKLKVVFYTLQLTESAIAARIDGAIAGIKLGDLKGSSVRVEKRIKRFGKIYGNSLIIRQFPSKRLSVSILRQHLKLLKASDFDPEVVIVDYGNLMTDDDIGADDGGGRSRQIGSIYEKLLALAQEENKLVLVPHQAPRSAWNKELLTIEDVSESSETCMVSPLVITLNRTAKDKAAGQARLFIAKNTYGADEILVTIPTKFESGCFYDVDPSKRFDK